MNQNNDSMPNTPPRTIADVPHAVKFNGRFYRRYDAAKYGDPGTSPEYRANNVVFKTDDDALTSTEESHYAVKYRGAIFVLSEVQIDDAVDLGEFVPSIVLAPSMPNTPPRT